MGHLIVQETGQSYIILFQFQGESWSGSQLEKGMHMIQVVM